MTVKPLADRVLVKNDKAETKTASGIIIPEAAQEKTQTATVVSVGPGTEEEKITVKAGDRIMYDKYAGTQVKIDGEDHLILKMADIIAVIEQKQTYVKKAVRTDCRFFLTEFFNSEKKVRVIIPKQIYQIIFRYKNA